MCKLQRSLIFSYHNMPYFSFLVPYRKVSKLKTVGFILKEISQRIIVSLKVTTAKKWQLLKTVYRNTSLGNTIIIFIIKQIYVEIKVTWIWPCKILSWWNILIKFSKQIGKSLAKIINIKGKWSFSRKSFFGLQGNSEFCQTSGMELFLKIVKNEKSFTVFVIFWIFDKVLNMLLNWLPKLRMFNF